MSGHRGRLFAKEVPLKLPTLPAVVLVYLNTLIAVRPHADAPEPRLLVDLEVLPAVVNHVVQDKSGETKVLERVQERVGETALGNGDVADG